MNTNIINIDSEQSFNGNSYDNFSLKTDYFPEIKNVVSIEISNVHFFYTSKGDSTLTSTDNGVGAGPVITPSMKFSNIFYRFLTINDIERMTYNTTADNMNSYTTKLLRNNNEDCLVPYPRVIEFNQPINIGNLNFSWFKEDGSQVTDLENLIDNADAETSDPYRFTFTLTIKSLQNSTLKNYNEMFNFSPEVLQRLAYVKIIEDKDKKDYTKEDNMGIPDNNYVPNTNEPTPYNFKDNSQQSSITGDYSNQTQEINNNVNYLSNGNRLQYNYNGFINGN